MSHGRFQNPVQAALTGVRDLFAAQPLAARLTDDLRLDGKTCLVTGASSGLGLAAAGQLAERGARVLMISRSGIPERGEEVRARAGGAAEVEQLRVDLADLAEVAGLAETLAERGERIDVLLENAGVATPRAKRTPQGLDAMFVTNVLGKALLVRRLLNRGVLRNGTFAAGGREDGPAPRIVFVSSDSHRGASAIDWDELGTFYEYGVNKGIHNYSYFKLVLNTFATELARRLTAEDGAVDVPTHVMCPGPVNTNIIRDAPPALKTVLRGIFTVAFRDPETAARPLVYQAVSEEFGDGHTNRYLHMFKAKDMDAKVYDAAEGARLWDWTEAFLAEHGFAV